MNAGNTVDEVVSENIRRLRLAQEPRKWSRTQLADKFNKYSPPGSRMWNEWRVIDLEVGRSGKPPSAVSWHELVTLCIVFDVLLWDLVLPADDREIVLSKDPLAADGFTEPYTNFVGRRELGEIVSGIPGQYVADPEAMKKFKQMFNKDNLAVAEILDRSRDLQRSLDHFTEVRVIASAEPASGDEPKQRAGADDS